MRVTKIIDQIFPFDQMSFEVWCLTQGLTAEYVNERSKTLGSMVNDYILKDESPGAKAEGENYLIYDCADRFREFVAHLEVDILEREQQCNYSENGSVLYWGIYDFIAKINNEKWLIDLKTYGIWKYGDIEPEYAEPSEDKLKKANLQTALYAQCFGEKLNRAVLHILPNGYSFLPFKSLPKKQLEKSIQLCKDYYTF